jgi:peptidylprolyl isomerase
VSNRRVGKGCTVKVHYIGRIGNGEIFDATQEDQPVEFRVGSGQVMREFEEALMGMALDEEKIFAIPPEKAYGQRNENVEQTIPRSELPAEYTPEVGDILGSEGEDKTLTPVRIKDLTDQTVTMDLNHPLAGETLYFHIKVVGLSVPGE